MVAGGQMVKCAGFVAEQGAFQAEAQEPWGRILYMGTRLGWGQGRPVEFCGFPLVFGGPGAKNFPQGAGIVLEIGLKRFSFSVQQGKGRGIVFTPEFEQERPILLWPDPRRL